MSKRCVTWAHSLRSSYPRYTKLALRGGFFLTLSLKNLKKMKKNNKKDEFLKFRITEKEKLIIKNRSKKSGKNVSEYSRFMLLNGEVISISLEEKRILAGLANNINQLVKLFHQTNKEPSNLICELQKLLIHMKNAYRRSA